MTTSSPTFALARAAVHETPFGVPPIAASSKATPPQALLSAASAKTTSRSDLDLRAPSANAFFTASESSSKATRGRRVRDDRPYPRLPARRTRQSTAIFLLKAAQPRRSNARASAKTVKRCANDGYADSSQATSEMPAWSWFDVGVAFNRTARQRCHIRDVGSPPFAPSRRAARLMRVNRTGESPPHQIRQTSQLRGLRSDTTSSTTGTAPPWLVHSGHSSPTQRVSPQKSANFDKSDPPAYPFNSARTQNRTETKREDRATRRRFRFARPTAELAASTLQAKQPRATAT